MSTKKKNLDVYLGEVFKQFIALKENDLKRSQEVFKSVFEQFKQKMGEQCNYFNKYASQILYGGSVSDGIKVSKLDEFDMDIVIRLPISYDDGENGIIIENDLPGFVKLKIIKAFDNLDKQKEWDTCHKVTRDWRDSDKYFLQNKFRQWLHGIVQKTLNNLNGKVTVNDVIYVMKYKASGPAYTLQIRNEDGEQDFQLDVDLVPVIRFMMPRWPEGYRKIDSPIKEWLVVPKPIKSIQSEVEKNRLWRLSFQDYERDMIKGCQQLKTTIRLVKKLRDSLGMKAIASYYIKTLFLWKVHNVDDKKYWQKKLSVIFREMVEELRNAVVNKKIPYFWHEENNLIEGVKPSLLQVYADKLDAVLKSIDNNDVEQVVYSLLSTEEKEEFKNSEFFKSQESLSHQVSIVSSVSSSSNEIDSPKPERSDNKYLHERIEYLCWKVERLSEKIDERKDLLCKVEMLSEKIDEQNMKIEKLELAIYKDKVLEVEKAEVIESDLNNSGASTETYDLLSF